MVTLSAVAGSDTLELFTGTLRNARKELKRARPDVSSVVVAKSDYSIKSQWVDGAHFVQCPATWSETITCQKCRICTKANRKSIIVFPAHGSGKNSANAMIDELNLIPSITLEA
jgi:hypothetical protein